MASAMTPPRLGRRGLSSRLPLLPYTAPFAPSRSPPRLANRLHHPRLRPRPQIVPLGRVALAEPVRQEIVQAHLLLPHEAAVGELAVHVQVQHRAQAARRGHLDRAPLLAAALSVVDLSGVGDLREPPGLPPADRAED